MKRKGMLGAIVLANLLGTQSGCRTTRPEVPPPPKFAADGRKAGNTPVGFGSAPRAGYMTDAATQAAPGIAAPGGDTTSVAGRNNKSNPAMAAMNGDVPASLSRSDLPSPLASNNSGKGMSSGGILGGMGSATRARRDDAVVAAGNTTELPPVAPIDPPVSLPPPPLVPPPAGIAPPASELPKAQTSQSPQALPPESAIPPVVAEPTP